jgi:hypothetical protein
MVSWYQYVLRRLHGDATARHPDFVEIQTQDHHAPSYVSLLPFQAAIPDPYRLGWSLPTIMFPLVRNAAGFTVARFVVGAMEGPFFPGVALMTSSWYVSEELPFRMALWHGAQTIS